MNLWRSCNKLVPTVRTICPAEGVPFIRFVLDKSSVHTRGVTRNFFDRHSDIHVIGWLLKSPYLNIFEHIWENGGEVVPAQERTKAQLLDHPTEDVPVIRFVLDKSGDQSRGVTRNFLDRLSDIHVIGWLLKSLYLNIIQHIWAKWWRTSVCTGENNSSTTLAPR